MNLARMDGSFETWRDCAREFLRAEIPPISIQWLDPQEPSLFASDSASFSSKKKNPVVSETPARVPVEFIDLAQTVACFRDSRRWSLLYGILWRLCHGEPKLLSILVDPEVAELFRMKQAIRRDVHKMKAFVRFREIRQGETSVFAAWYEPDHFIVQRAAPFFAQRFGEMSWAILTPDLCVAWDRAEQDLNFFPALTKREADELLREDSTEELWKLYYAHIFNPARIKLKAMKAEMPMHFWKNLPEAGLIPDLVKGAGQRVRDFKKLKESF